MQESIFHGMTQIKKLINYKFYNIISINYFI